MNVLVRLAICLTFVLGAALLRWKPWPWMLLLIPLSAAELGWLIYCQSRSAKALDRAREELEASALTPEDLPAP